MRLSLALLARRLHARAVDQTTLHRAIGKQMQRVDELDYRVRDRWRAVIGARRRALDAITGRLRDLDVRLRFIQARRRVEACEASAVQIMKLRLSRANGALGPLEAHLAQLSPLKILDRGYAIVEQNGKIVKAPVDAPLDSEVRIRLANGELRGRVF
jgi:exodeoxyribonuclease VII large subunit